MNLNQRKLFQLALNSQQHVNPYILAIDHVTAQNTKL